MKIILTLLLVSLISFSISGQIFEGKITYANSYQSKVAGLTNETLYAMMGTRQDYYIKGGKFKNVFNGSFLKWQVYSPTQNKLYSLTAKTDTMYWDDCLPIKDEPVSYEIQKDKETLLGIVCDVLIISTKKQKMYFYFNPGKLLLDPSLFEDMNYSNWYYTISKTRALCYKTVIETQQFIVTSVVTEIAAMQLKDGFFDIPLIPGTKNPFN
jgi:hypothetical protein